ncbi:hypothetical protein M2323_002864 [Rhodoblastus acidophilus]|uniref:MCP four helix bundle domain-containing protein n=1 Tax=Rhodoblastus acidophilus TaxID=1074 RepID=UPI002224BCE2|nr:MCP four helix bundle domain-containing protein [Rhodoblastus acidophilus]MCW2285009.1 hypothetical protein [Rhodoblastus acidophilus]MCW2333927.1 hypothetical protein [Rhodoblastus acidophilus]
MRAHSLFQSKAALVAALSIGVVVGVGAVASLQISAMDSAAQRLQQKSPPALVLLPELRAAVADYRISEGHALLAGMVEDDRREDLQRDAAVAAAKVDAAIAAFKPLGADEARRAQELAAKWRRFRANSQAAIETAGKGDTAAAVRIFVTTDLAAAQALASTIESSLSANAEQDGQAAQDTEMVLFRARQNVGVTLAIVAGLGAIASAILMFGAVAPGRGAGAKTAPRPDGGGQCPLSPENCAHARFCRPPRACSQLSAHLPERFDGFGATPHTSFSQPSETA